MQDVGIAVIVNIKDSCDVAILQVGWIQCDDRITLEITDYTTTDHLDNTVTVNVDWYTGHLVATRRFRLINRLVAIQSCDDISGTGTNISVLTEVGPQTVRMSIEVAPHVARRDTWKFRLWLRVIAVLGKVGECA